MSIRKAGVKDVSRIVGQSREVLEVPGSRILEVKMVKKKLSR